MIAQNSCDSGTDCQGTANESTRGGNGGYCTHRHDSTEELVNINRRLVFELLAHFAHLDDLLSKIRMCRLILTREQPFKHTIYSVCLDFTLAFAERF